VVFVHLHEACHLYFFAETFLRLTRKKEDTVVENEGVNRAISLREGRPFCVAHSVPGDYWFEISDNLEKRVYTTRFDEDGFLMPSKVHENPDREIFFLGGSSTFCEYMDEESRFPSLSGRLLTEKTGLLINSYNAGFSFNNSLHSINVLNNKILPLSPDMVVLMHAINDAFTLAVYESYWEKDSRNVNAMVEIPPSSPPGKSVARGLKDLLVPNLFDAGRKAMSRFRGSKQVPVDETILGKKYKGGEFYVEKFKKNLLLFINICRAYEIVPVLMTQPNRLTDHPDPAISNYVRFLQGVDKNGNAADAKHYLPLTYEQYAGLEGLFNEAVRQVGVTQDVLVIDLEKNIPKTKEYLYDIVHLTKKGSEKVSEIIAAHLAPILGNPKPVAKIAGEEVDTGSEIIEVKSEVPNG
jgi:hypothetical protein